MSNATFINISDEPFTGWWNGVPKTFAPGQEKLMPAWLAEHFAKHLTNRELIKNGKETYTSPKNPRDVPEFMQIFNRAFKLERPAPGANEIDEIIDSAAAEPSMDIALAPRKTINNGPAAAEEDEYDAGSTSYAPPGPPTVVGEVTEGEE